MCVGGEGRLRVRIHVPTCVRLHSGDRRRGESSCNALCNENLKRLGMVNIYVLSRCVCE